MRRFIRDSGDPPAAVMHAADWLVAKRAGFECEGLMRSFAPLDGSRVNAYLYARISGAAHSAAVIS